jgi:hypothetical protein
MPSLEFEQALSRFEATIAGANIIDQGPLEDEVVQRTAEADTIYVVRFIEYRLSTSIKRIGGWTFIADNEFLTNHVARIFMVWLWFGGRADIESRQLRDALRHCFKRFYAEVAIIEHSTQFGRAMLIESKVFEREILRPMEQEAASNEAFADLLSGVTNCVRVIGRWHEIGHYNLQKRGLSAFELSPGIFEGIATRYLKELVDEGQEQLAEEVYCDLFALQEMISSPDSPLSRIEYVSRFKIALFCSICATFMSMVGFDARTDARNALFQRSESSYFDSEFFPIIDQTMRRSQLVEEVIERYSVKKGISIYGAGEEFNLMAQMTSYFRHIYYSYFSMSEKMEPGTNLCDAEHRKLAAYLALAIDSTPVAATYLIACSEDFTNLDMDTDKLRPGSYFRSSIAAADDHYRHVPNMAPRRPFFG